MIKFSTEIHLISRLSTVEVQVLRRVSRHSRKREFGGFSWLLRVRAGFIMALRHLCYAGELMIQTP